MRMCLRVASFLALALLALTTTTRADGSDQKGGQSSLRGPIFDITHFDVIPLAPPQADIDFQQKAYNLLFAYRDGSQSDPGLESFRIVNWVIAANHSQIIDVWKDLEAFNRHLAQPHSIRFRFAVQGNADLCCIGSPIDDRQYSLVKSFGRPWTSNSLPSTVGADGALFVITYTDFLEEALEEDPDVGQNKLVAYGAASSKANRGHLLSYTVLQQLDRPNRDVFLEVWDTATNYTAWQGSAVTTTFITQTMPLLGSPFDHRLNILCGETYDDKNGCIPP